MRRITLTNSDRQAVVGDEDYAGLADRAWRAVKGARPGELYAARSRTREDDDGPRTVLMHVEIMRPARGMVVDHKDGDGLNNQRSNLRVVTGGENTRNYRKPLGEHTSKYKGVSWDAGKGKWKVQCRDSEGKNRTVGRFDSEEEAARAYDGRAKLWHGALANLNFPDNGSEPPAV